jgi:hypothetical protein
VKIPQKKASGKRSEKSLADEIQKRKGDTSGWSKGPANVALRKGDGVVFSLRLSADELEEIRDRARAGRISVSELIRRALFPAPIMMHGRSLTLPDLLVAPSTHFGGPHTGANVEVKPRPGTTPWKVPTTGAA